MSVSYDGNKYHIKVVSGSRSSVDALIKNELKEYPTNHYGTVILHLDDAIDIKTVRIVRCKTKELYDGKNLHREDLYPFSLGNGL